MNHFRNAIGAACMTVLVGGALLPGVSVADELNCPAFPEPQNAKVQWVAPFMVYNGVPMSIKRFDSEQRPADILAFYRRAWGGGPPNTAPVENVVDPWQTIAVARGKCFYTVQVQAADKGSTGMLSITEAPLGPRARSSDQTLPMLSGSAIINDIEHRDDGKNARTVLLSNTFSPESNADFYRRTLGDQGWQAVSSYQMQTKKGPGITLVMKRGLAEASLVITRAGSQTTVLANMVDRP
jgi:hypothetical protein